MEKHLNATASPSPATPTLTTFVQADANTFRDLVQKLTGFASNTEKLPVTLPGAGKHSSKPSNIPGDPTGLRRPPFKLQERRQHTMRRLEIKLGLTTLHNSPSHSSPKQARRHDSPTPSPVTPLGSESLFYASSGTISPSSPAVSEEEKAIAEKGFYLHPSPLNTPRGNQPPELLTLFPLNSHSQARKD
ncbi:hypothetical protein PTKIN_Ptkin03bG0174500 [Pterospermum kingtungense]